MAEGLRRLLESDFDIVGLAENGEELLDLIVREEGMKPRVVVLSMHSEEAYVRAALAEGAMGYVLKRGDPEEIVTALQEALAGRS